METSAVDILVKQISFFTSQLNHSELVTPIPELHVYTLYMYLYRMIVALGKVKKRDFTNFVDKSMSL